MTTTFGRVACKRVSEKEIDPSTLLLDTRREVQLAGIFRSGEVKFKNAPIQEFKT